MVASSSAAFFNSSITERKTVDEDHDIRPAIVFILDDRELIDRQPIVIFRIVEIDQPRLRTANGTVGSILNRNAVNQ